MCSVNTVEQIKEYIQKIFSTIDNDNSGFGKILVDNVFEGSLARQEEYESDNIPLPFTKPVLNLMIAFSLADYLSRETADMPGRNLLFSNQIVPASKYFAKYPKELRKCEVYYTSDELYNLLSLLDDDGIRRILGSVTDLSFEAVYKAYIQHKKSEFCHLLREVDTRVLSQEWCMEFMLSKSMEQYCKQLYQNQTFQNTANEIISQLTPNTARIISLLESMSSSDQVLPQVSAQFMEIYPQALAELEFHILHYSNLPSLTLYRKIQFEKIINAYSFVFEDISTVDLNLPNTNPEATMHVVYNIGKMILNFIRTGCSNKETDQIIYEGTLSSEHRLDFPTRLTSSQCMSELVSAQEQRPILEAVYMVYGGSFEDISCEDFLYLFGGAFCKKPGSYNPPYYWNGNESTMKALLRVFYTQQPRLVKDLILHESDKETGSKTHNWGRNKHKVAYQEVEHNIIKIVFKVTGKTLKKL